MPYFAPFLQIASKVYPMPCAVSAGDVATFVRVPVHVRSGVLHGVRACSSSNRARQPASARPRRVVSGCVRGKRDLGPAPPHAQLSGSGCPARRRARRASESPRQGNQRPRGSAPLLALHTDNAATSCNMLAYPGLRDTGYLPIKDLRHRPCPSALLCRACVAAAHGDAGTTSRRRHGSRSAGGWDSWGTRLGPVGAHRIRKMGDGK